MRQDLIPDESNNKSISANREVHISRMSNKLPAEKPGAKQSGKHVDSSVAEIEK